MTNAEAIQVLHEMQAILDESRRRVETARAALALKNAIKYGEG